MVLQKWTNQDDRNLNPNDSFDWSGKTWQSGTYTKHTIISLILAIFSYKVIFQHVMIKLIFLFNIKQTNLWDEDDSLRWVKMGRKWRRQNAAEHHKPSHESRNNWESEKSELITAKVLIISSCSKVIIEGFRKWQKYDLAHGLKQKQSF